MVYVDYVRYWGAVQMGERSNVRSRLQRLVGSAEYFPTQKLVDAQIETVSPFARLGAPFSPKPKEFLRIPAYLSVCQPLPTDEEVRDCRKARHAFDIQGYPAPYIDDIIRGFRLLKGARSYIEIGTFDRGNLAYVSSLLADDAVLIGVDTQHEQLRDGLLKSCLKSNQRYISVVGDSMAPETVEKVRDALGGETADAVFIDGNHTAYAVMSDYCNYGGLIREDGLVLFHDSLWEGDQTYKGVADALSEIDRLTPIYLIPGHGPCHRYMRTLFRDPQWGVVGVCRVSSSS